jgi:hypothetical protein
MKNRTADILSSLALMALLTACTREMSVKSLSFGASADNATITAGDSAVFKFTGSPDFISFYSGEPGHRYAYRDRIDADGTPVLTFTSARANGSQANSLQVMVSADFKGINLSDTAGTISNIWTGNWTDITSRATLSTGTAVASGDIDLSDFAKAGKPVYIAFKHNGYVGTTYSKWTITNFLVTNKLADSTSYIIANMAANTTQLLNYSTPTYSPGFIAMTAYGKYHWVVTAGTSLLITGATSAAAATDSSENWAIVGPIDLKKVSPDMGVPIKMISENMQKFPYSYQYLTKGNYQATFVASNVNADAEDHAVRTVNVNVQ